MAWQPIGFDSTAHVKTNMEHKKHYWKWVKSKAQRVKQRRCFESFGHKVHEYAPCLLLETSASLLVTGALLVVTMFAIRNNMLD